MIPFHYANDTCSLISNTFTFVEWISGFLQIFHISDDMNKIVTKIVPPGVAYTTGVSHNPFATIRREGNDYAKK